MYEEILEYQKKEKELIDIERELGQSEERKRISRARNFLTEVDKNISDMDLRAATLNNTFSKLNDKMKSLESELNEYKNLLGKSKGEDEINYYIKKVTKLDEDLSVATSEASQIISDVKDLLIAFDDYKKKVKSAKDEYEEYKVKYDALKETRKGEIDKIQGELKSISKKVPKEIMESYRKVRDRKIFPAIVPANGNSCGGCRMEISMNKMSQLTTKGIIECEECGRLIYNAAQK